jgi:hypothetical protein
MKYPENIYPPVTEFERRTGECPLFVALFILDEVRNYFWTDLPEDLADEVAQKAEIVFAGNTRWREKFQGRRGRAYLEMFMRHWLAAALFKRRSPLFRELPDSFKNGKQLPVISLFRQKEMGEAKTESRCLAKSRSRRKSRAAANSRPSSRFVHGTQVTKKG